MKPLYTIHELATALHLQPATIRNRLYRGEDMPPSIRVGRRRLFPEAQLEAWLQAHEVGRCSSAATDSAEFADRKPPGRPQGPGRD